MVARLCGKIDGQPVNFQRRDGDWWEATIPKDLDGEYIVELQAWDEAGNMAYATRMLFVVDCGSIKVNMTPMPYYAVLLEHPFYIQLRERGR